jgi:hypothetical protein
VKRNQSRKCHKHFVTKRNQSVAPHEWQSRYSEQASQGFHRMEQARNQECEAVD